MDKKQRIGQYIKSSGGSKGVYRCYIPRPLPPQPELNMQTLYMDLDRASSALGRLDGISQILPDMHLFLTMYVRREASLSSQIEGTQSSFFDLLLFENSSIDENGQNSQSLSNDVVEISAYVSALEYGLERIKELPLSLRLIKEIHFKLMNHAQGGNKNPGEFRTIQNWIGGSRPENAIFVPPPPGEQLMTCLDAFEKFLHDKNTSPLIKAALVHVQFETIHPFLDGNGRLGRLLITFILCTEGVLKKPLLYLSLYFKKNRQAYYDHLQSVRETGDWEGWISFFLKGIADTADHATQMAETILQLFQKDREKINKSHQSTGAILKIYEHLQKHPLTMTASIRKKTGLSQRTIMRSLFILEALDIVKEITGKERHKVFAYKRYLDLLIEDTEPL